MTALFDQLVNELKECKAGSRGWVDISKARAKKIGVVHANLTVSAESLGLKVERHGRYGYVASR